MNDFRTWTLLIPIHPYGYVATGRVKQTTHPGAVRITRRTSYRHKMLTLQWGTVDSGVCICH